MSGIFISYRRNDTAGYAGRLHEALSRHFGADQVFLDVGDLHPGLDFATALDQAVASTDVLLALIGPHWLSITNSAGNRRLDDPNDYVRLEIATALAREGIRVVPVLVRGTSMPRADVLPDDLKSLARRHAIELSDERWDHDVATLIAELKSVVTPARTSWLRRPLALAATGGVLILGLVIGLVLYGVLDLGPPDPDPNASGGSTPTQVEIALATVTEETTDLPTTEPSSTATQQSTSTATATARLTPTQRPIVAPTSTPTSAAATQQPTSTLTATLPASSGARKIEVTGWEIEVTDVEIRNTMLSNVAEGIYVIVFFEVTNTSRLEDSFPYGALVIMDAQGNEYTSSSTSEPGWALVHNSTGGSPGDGVTPGTTIETAWAFDVPVNATGLMLSEPGWPAPVELGP